MLSTLRSYEAGNSKMARLIEDLDELLLSLSDENPAWREQFKTAWSVLEERGQADVDAGASAMTRQAVLRLESLVADEIARREREHPAGWI